jgi:hypothetical protein
MKPMLIAGLIGILTSALPAAGASPKDTLIAANRQLGERKNYSWSASTRKADGGSGKLGPIEGKAENGGVTYLSFSIGSLLIEVFRNGPKGAGQVQMGGWQTLDEIAGFSGTSAAIVRYVRGYKAPVAESANLAGNVTDLKEADGAFSGELKEDAVKDLLLLGTSSRQGQEPQATGVKGSVRFWIKEGILAKYKIKVQGKITAGDRESTISRTTTVEIKNIGSTNMDVPAAARQKMT